MSSNEPRRYWDACTFIALLTKEEGRWDVCKRLFEEAERELWRLVTSTLTLGETCRKRGVGVLHDQRDMIEDFFERSTILLVTIDRPLAVAARKNMFDYELNSNDAMHLAAAERAKCDVLYTYDDHLLKIADRIENILIQAPSEKPPGMLL